MMAATPRAGTMVKRDRVQAKQASGSLRWAGRPPCGNERSAYVAVRAGDARSGLLMGRAPTSTAGKLGCTAVTAAVQMDSIFADVSTLASLVLK